MLPGVRAASGAGRKALPAPGDLLRASTSSSPGRLARTAVFRSRAQGNVACFLGEVARTPARRGRLARPWPPLPLALHVGAARPASTRWGAGEVRTRHPQRCAGDARGCTGRGRGGRRPRAGLRAARGRGPRDGPACGPGPHPPRLPGAAEAAVPTPARCPATERAFPRVRRRRRDVSAPAHPAVRLRVSRLPRPSTSREEGPWFHWSGPGSSGATTR